MPGRAGVHRGEVRPVTNYFVSELLLLGIFYATTYVLGVAVKSWQVRVNYTRKIIHFMLFFAPSFLSVYFPYEKTLYSIVGSCFFFLGYLATLAAPVRARVPALATGFAAIDRPEDRPFTLLWLSTQTAATYVVIVALIIAFAQVGRPELIYLPLIINGIGDGLAEPVGVRFGRHRYTVKALFSDRRYTRSLEGSACVFISAVVGLAFLSASFTPTQLIAAFLLVPLASAVVEAVSPHTWDSPFIYGVVGMLTLLIVTF